MVIDPIERVFSRWSEFDADWQGVLLAAVIGLIVGIFGVSIPW